MPEVTPPELPQNTFPPLTQPGAPAQPTTLDIGPAHLTGHQGNRFTFTGVESRARVRLTILAPDLARVDLLPEWIAAPPRSWAVAKAENDWPTVPLEVADTPDGSLIIRTPAMAIKVTLAPIPFQIQFFNTEGICLSADTPTSLSVVPQNPGPTPYLVQRGAWGARCAKQLLAGEHFFGFGERTGSLNKHGSRFLLWNIDPHGPHSNQTWAMYSAIPFFLSVRQQQHPLTYGIFLDSPALTEFDLGATQPDRLTFGVGAGTARSPTISSRAMVTTPCPPSWHAIPN